MGEHLENLRALIATFPRGGVPDATAVERSLALAWDELSASVWGMQGYKVIGRTERMQWDPPRLTFTIERHGAIVGGGSTRAELQTWAVDVESGTAEVVEVKMRQVYKSASRLDVLPVALRVAQEVAGDVAGPHIRRQANGVVRVVVGMIPEVADGSAVAQTLNGRRARFRVALDKAVVARGFEVVGFYRFKRLA